MYIIHSCLFSAHSSVSMLLQRDNKHMRDTIMKLERENEYLTRELVGSKASLREEMDKVSRTTWRL